MENFFLACMNAGRQVVKETITALLEILELLRGSFFEIAKLTVLGTILGLVIGIALTIILKLAYFNRVPKKVKKCFGFFVGFFLILGGISSGLLFGFRAGTNRAARIFVFGTESLIYEKINVATGIDLWKSLDENFGITRFEVKLENEIVRLRESASESLSRSSYGNAYKAVCSVQTTAQPFYEIFTDVYHQYGFLFNKVVGLDKLRQKPAVAFSIDLYNTVNDAIQLSFYNQNSHTKNVDFLENLVKIKDDINYLKMYCIGEVIHEYVAFFVMQLQRYINFFIDPIIAQVIVITLFWEAVFLLPVIIRHILYCKKEAKAALAANSAAAIGDNNTAAIADNTKALADNSALDSAKIIAGGAEAVPQEETPPLTQGAKSDNILL